MVTLHNNILYRKRSLIFQLVRFLYVIYCIFTKFFFQSSNLEIPKRFKNRKTFQFGSDFTLKATV